MSGGINIEAYVNHYAISEQTEAIIPARHMDYQSIIYERDRWIYVNQRPLSIIKAACIKGGATYEGRMIAMQQLLQIRQKLPVPIQPHRHIYAFPTESPRNFNCQWIFPNHIQAIIEEDVGVTLLFTHARLHLNLSLHTLKRQLNYTTRCEMLLSGTVNDLTAQRI